ncbi:MAG: S8 family serine peptidase, partial [Candidatus Omnitrophica bacterium]|nr:S8 family serine peptidase [Candidatus Omnitrophota bacterium]
DEPFYDNGTPENADDYGRIDYQARHAADADGAIGYYHEYHTGTDTKSRTISYVSLDYSDVASPLPGNRVGQFIYDSGGMMTERYTYYTDTDRVESYTEYAGDPEIYHHFRNTAAHEMDGLVLRNADPDDFYARAYKASFSGDYTTFVQGYKSADYTTDASAPAYSDLLVQREYTTNGTELYKQESWYFDSGNRETVLYNIGDNGSGVIYQHYSSSVADQVNYEKLGSVDADGAIAYYYEYYGDGTLRKKIGYDALDITDVQNPVAGNTVIIYEYDELGELKKKMDMDDDITVWYVPNDSTKEFVGQYVGIGYIGAEYSTNTYYTYLVDDTDPDIWYTNTKVDPDGTYTEFHYDASYNLTGASQADGARTIYRDLAADLSVEKTIQPDPEFARGVNLPWTHYGYDVGMDTTANGASHMGYSADFSAVIDRMRERQGDYMRAFIFNDLRSGITFDASGNPTGFTDKVYEDMQALLDAAKMLGIKVLPVLLDWTIADGVSTEDGTPVGEHPDLITDDTAGGKREQLLSLMGQFVDHFKDNDTICGWEIMNEPEEATTLQYMNGVVDIADMQDFVKDFIGMLHTADPDTYVTLGSQDRNFLVDYWTDTALGVSAANGLDVYQYHYYNSMENYGKGLDYQAANFDKPTIIGEVDPTSDADNNMTVMEKLDNIYSNGYSGAFFWEDESALYTITDAQYADMKQWIYTIDGQVKEYYDVSELLKRHIKPDGDIYEYLDEDWESQGYGRLSLLFDEATQEYKTYDWDTPSAGQVTMSVYSGDYTTSFGDALDVDVQASELSELYVYATNGEEINLDADPASANFNGWDMLEKNLYTSGSLDETITYYADTGLMKEHIYTSQDGYGNLYYSYTNEDWNGQGYGRLTGLEKADGTYYEYLSWYSGTEDVKKQEEFTARTGGSWVETIWKRANGNPLKNLKSTGVAAIYFDDSSWTPQTYWAGDGSIDHYASISDYNSGWIKDWRVTSDASGNSLEVYEFYETSRRYKYVHKYGWSDANNRWEYALTEYRDDTGGTPYGTWIDQYATMPGDATAQLVYTDYPDPVGKPERSMTESIDLTGELNEPDADMVSDEMLDLYDGLEGVRDVYDGTGITVALLDSGVRTDGLGIELIDSVSFADGLSGDAEDILGHGTATAEVITDTAPGAHILDVRVMNGDNETSSSILSEAIKYAVEMGARVLAMPLSLYPVSDMLDGAIDYAAQKEAVLVTAAGNEGAEILKGSLASKDNVITVGSVDNDGKLSAWSNIGEEVDLYAPWDVIEEGEGQGGTSFSAAFVAGLASLVLEEDPDMTAGDVLSALKTMMADIQPEIREKLESDEIKGESVNEVVDMYEMLRK